MSSDVEIEADFTSDWTSDFEIIRIDDLLPNLLGIFDQKVVDLELGRSISNTTSNDRNSSNYRSSRGMSVDSDKNTSRDCIVVTRNVGSMIADDRIDKHDRFITTEDDEMDDCGTYTTGNDDELTTIDDQIVKNDRFNLIDDDLSIIYNHTDVNDRFMTDNDDLATIVDDQIEECDSFDPTYEDLSIIYDRANSNGSFNNNEDDLATIIDDQIDESDRFNTINDDPSITRSHGDCLHSDHVQLMIKLASESRLRNAKFDGSDHIEKILINSSRLLNEIDNMDEMNNGNDAPPLIIVIDADEISPSKIKTEIMQASSQCSEDSGMYSGTRRHSDEESWMGSSEGSSTEISYSNRVVLEILETEAQYVNDLRQIIVGYCDEWKGDPNCLLTLEQINDLFGNIEEIYHFNRWFLWELDQCGLDAVKIAKCFVDNNVNFSIYATYCTNYPRSMTVLTELMRHPSTGYLFRERQSSLQHTLPLGSYLLKPVQRILKYHLLLQNMLKYSCADESGRADMTVALSTMTGIAHHINGMKRRHEHAVRVQQLQSLLIGWTGADLTTYGELYAEGSFRIEGSKAPRHIFLFEKILIVTKSKDATSPNLQYKMHIMCSNLMLIECVPKEPLCFQLIPFDNARLQITVHARSVEEKRHWSLEIKRVILENYQAEIPSHARQLVMELGQSKNNDCAPLLDRLVHRRHHLTPDYLQRRSPRQKKRSLRSRLQPFIPKCDDKKVDKCKHENIESDGFHNDCSSDLSCSSLNETSYSSSMSCSLDASFSHSDITTDEEESASLFLDDSVANYNKKEKAIEEIITQLLLGNQDFQKVTEAKIIPEYGRPRSDSYSVNDCAEFLMNQSYENLKNILNYVKMCESEPNNPLDSNISLNSITENFPSLSESLTTLKPMTPLLWLKKQSKHFPIGSKKADSLPRTFQINILDEDWKNNRPKTIASDKVQPNSPEFKSFEDCDANCLFSKFKNSNFKISSLFDLEKHPQCKFYRTSVAKITFRRLIREISRKMAGMKVESTMEDQANLSEDRAVSYKLGSSNLGARIANNSKPDYADPTILFSFRKGGVSILNSKDDFGELFVSQRSGEICNILKETNFKSDNNADNFYEKKFDEMETLVAAVRNSMIFDDEINFSKFHNFCKFTPRVTIHKPIKIPPPVPPKPKFIKNFEVEAKKKVVRDNLKTVKKYSEFTIPTQGWVKQMVEKMQA